MTIIFYPVVSCVRFLFDPVGMPCPHIKSVCQGRANTLTWESLVMKWTIPKKSNLIRLSTSRVVHTSSTVGRNSRSDGLVFNENPPRVPFSFGIPINTLIIYRRNATDGADSVFPWTERWYHVAPNSRGMTWTLDDCISRNSTNIPGRVCTSSWWLKTYLGCRNWEVMSSLRQSGGHDFEAPSWILLCCVMCFGQWTGVW